jgi:hypothetical protein
MGTDWRYTSETFNSSISLSIIHQSFRGLNNKCNEFIVSLIRNPYPLTWCVYRTLWKWNLPCNKIKNAYLGQSFLQSIHQGVSTCIFIDLPCIILDVSQFCVEKMIELCAVQNNVRDAHLSKYVFIDHLQETLINS